MFLQAGVRYVSGIGQKNVEVVGTFKAVVFIDGEVYEDIILVLSDDATHIPIPMMVDIDQSSYFDD